MLINLNEEQEEAYNYICSGYNVFITGGGGVGKSALINYYIRINKGKKFELGITSTTGTSAILINGTTIHSYLGIGTGKKDVDSICDKINQSNYLKKKWLMLKVLIIDEVSMMSAEFFDKLENIAKRIRNSNKPFGGIQLILSGDFCQLPPIDCRSFCFEAKSWPSCVNKIVNLTKIIRQDNLDFQKCLSQIRLGNFDDETIKIINSRINSELSNDYGIEPTKLFSKNALVDDINKSHLKILLQKNKKFTYLMTSNIDGIKNDIYKKLVPASEKLELCLGCQVMLTFNLDINNHLVNGSRGIITGFEYQDGNYLPRVKFLNGKECNINFNSWNIEEDGKSIGNITQLPLRLAYAFSIHKAQGCSLDYAIVDLSDLFDYGMAYVALSRVRSLDGLSIVSIDWNKIKVNPKAKDFYQGVS